MHPLVQVYCENMCDNQNFTPLGKTDFRNQQTPFFIKDADRLRHLYVIGKTGVGKSTLLLNMAVSDLQKGKGCCILDPHGDIADMLLDYVPEGRIRDVIYFSVTEKERLPAFNPLYNIAGGNRHIVASGLISTFKKIWADSWGPRLEYILHQCLLTLLHYPKATLLDIQPLLTNKAFQEEVLMFVTDIHLKTYWYTEYDKYSPSFRMEAISPILNKMGIFITNPILRGIVGQQESIDIRQIVDTGKIFLCNLSKGIAGEEVSSLLGSMLLSALQHAVLERADIAEEKRKPFYCYIDECGSFLTTAFIGILSEARKYGLSLFLAHQYLDQLPEHIRSSIFGNVGTIISFQIGNSDAETVAKEFFPIFTASDFINLPKYSFYIKLMIDGVTSKGFSALSLPPSEMLHFHKKVIVQQAQAKFKQVEAELHNKPVKLLKPAQNTLFDSL